MLDTKRIRISTPAQLRDYYNELAHHLPVESITTQLLQAIERGSIPSLTFAPWLGVSKSPAVIHTALKQNKSVLVRKLGIKQLRHDLSSPRWKETWDGIGGTAGILDIFHDLSVIEVRQACKAIGGCAKGKELKEKRKCYTDLFMALHPSAFPDAEVKTIDSRPLGRYYGLLMPACSEELVDKAVSSNLEGVWLHTRGQDLLYYHSESMRRKQLQNLWGDRTNVSSRQILKSLIKEYPSASTQERGFSASMEFALTVLHTLAGSGKSQVEDDFFIDDIVRPLLKRAIKKHARWETIYEIVDLTMQYLEAHPTAGKEITDMVDDVRHLVAQCWSRKPQLFEKHLRRLCSHPIFGTATKNKLQDWNGFFERIMPARCYALLKLVFKESTGLDLDNDADLKHVKGSLDDYLLSNLNTEEASSLFARLRDVRGDEDLVQRGKPDSILSISANVGDTGDPDLYQIVLQCRNGKAQEAEENAAIYLQARKKKASSASQPEIRGFNAKSALFAAIGSGSLVIYQETIEWSKLFLRDPLAVSEMYPQWCPKETSRLLSGIPEPLQSLSSLSDLRQRVEKGNSILESMFDIACMALGEPSFSVRDWQGTLDLFISVIQQRIDLSPKLKKLHKASDEDLYHSLWDSTIPMLISIEEKANQEDAEKLGADDLRGILGGALYANIELKPEVLSTMTFLDNLAKERDSLWQKLRPKVYPTVAALPAPFPRGLPIQHLTAPWVLNVENLENCVPYLASRVKAAVFPDPAATQHAVPTDDESQKAIGVFVDSYYYALQLHLPKCLPTGKMELRVKEAWNFAIGSLSQGRMDGSEALRFWSNQKPEYLKAWNKQKPEYLKVWPPKDVREKHATWPLIPESGNLLEPQEWNPFASGRPNLPARDLGEPTYMDLSLAVLDNTPYHPTIRHRIESVVPEIPAREVEMDTIWNSSRKMGEGGVLSALLYLDTRYVSDHYLLGSPFPSEDDPRYPCLYLSDEFLSSDHLYPMTAVRNIRGHLDATPPALLAQLAQNIIQALDTANSDATSNAYIILHEVAMLLVVRLGESDRPQLATELAIRTVLDRPKSSSWHRQLLKPSLLRRLSASEAQACIEAFADQVFDRLPAKDSEVESCRDEHSDTGSEFGEQSSEKPFVKVTTQKFLAQLLQGTGVVGEEYAFSVLLSLHKKTSHIDVQYSVVKAFLEMLQSGSPAISTKVLAALERMLPLAGGLNEREPVTEADWTRCEETLTLPDLQEGVSDSPILAALISHFCNAPNNARLLQSFIDRIILPTLMSLKQQMVRWVTLFLRKYGVEVSQTELHIPSVPRHPSVSRILLSVDSSKVSYLPSTVLEEYVAYITFNITPSKPIRELNKRLRKNSALKSKSEVQTWLSLYGQGIDAMKAFKTFDLVSRLGVDAAPTNSISITPKVVQEQFLKLFTAVLWNDTATYTVLEDCLTRRFLEGQYLTAPLWQPYGKQIVEAMITYINSIRTRDWERDPCRKPSVLPDTLSWRLLLLDYPWPSNEDGEKDRDNKCKTFANQLKSIIDEIGGSRYHNKLSQLESYLALDPVSSTENRSATKIFRQRYMFYEKRDTLHEALVHNRLLTAVYLGDITKTRLSWITAPELLRVEVSCYLVEMVDDFVDVERGLKEKVGELVESWIRCENEEVRRMGWRLREKYFSSTA
ncbi:Nn.00g108120.m01.CDS01 [Neocucurbitaria sp. VM-36]